MGRTPEDKRAMVAEIKETLNVAQLAIVIDYQGLSV
jgi:ribosomal protein L10